MLLHLFVLSLILLQLPVNNVNALPKSEVGARQSQFNQLKSLYTKWNPFKFYWKSRPAFDKPKDEILLDGPEGRPWPFNGQRPSNKIGIALMEDDPSSRIINRLASKSGNSNGNTLLSTMRKINPLMTYYPCTSTNGEEDGICLPSPVCSFYGGRSSGGNCRVATTCCVNEVNKCGALVTMNNTYWSSPPSVSSGSTCGLTIKLDEYLIEQRGKICQIRLDFITFSIAQPNSETVCNVDSFQVAGATNRIPVICGDNNGQHMYLAMPTGATSAQLLMAFGTSTAARSWKIKIGLLPCNSEYLAPDECLQYFTSASGTVLSFNWKDTAGSATRQLANQDYYICFRTELVNKQSSNQVATTLCLSECQVTGGVPFSLSGTAAGTSQAAAVTSCSNDYLVFPGGFSLPAAVPVNQRDRFCGTRLSQATASATAQTICSTAKPFRLLYRTNGDDTITNTVDTANLGNLGFCLSYEQKLS